MRRIRRNPNGQIVSTSPTSVITMNVLRSNLCSPPTKARALAFRAVQTRGIKTFRLNTGANIPAIGFGTFQDPGAQEDAVSRALKAGLRLIDTARVYDVEKQVGKGIKASGVPRDQVFLGTKLWCNNYHPDDVEKALDESLKDLDTPYVDLLMMHYPCTFSRGAERFPRDRNGKMIHGETNFVDTWKAMAKLVNTGKTRAIGVSNFSKGELETLIKDTDVVSSREAGSNIGQKSVLSDSAMNRSLLSIRWKSTPTCNRSPSISGSVLKVSTWSNSALWAT